MSLKGFHLVFITFSTLLALVGGLYCIRVNIAAGAPVYLAGAIVCFAAAIGLTVYGAWFYKKMKRLGLFT